MIVVGPDGRVELETEDGKTGEPSVDEVTLLVGIVIVYVVPVEMVMLLVITGVLETPVGPGRLEVLELPVTGAIGVELDKDSVPVRGRLEIG